MLDSAKVAQKSKEKHSTSPSLQELYMFTQKAFYVMLARKSYTSSYNQGEHNDPEQLRNMIDHIERQELDQLNTPQIYVPQPIHDITKSIKAIYSLIHKYMLKNLYLDADDVDQITKYIPYIILQIARALEIIENAGNTELLIYPADIVDIYSEAILIVFSINNEGLNSNDQQAIFRKLNKYIQSAIRQTVKRTSMKITTDVSQLYSIIQETKYRLRLSNIELIDFIEQNPLLDDREKYILVLFYYYTMSFSEIAEELEITHVRVRQILTKSLRKLRHII